MNRACRLTGDFLGHDKTYVGIMRIHEEIDIEKLKKAINDKFIGKIKQTPPVKSRVKRQEREREVKRFEILEQDENGKDFVFIAEVQGGTYIRKLIDDLGKEIGVGAHMLELRRIRAGIFSEQDPEFVNLYDFEKAVDFYVKEKDEKLLRKILIPGEIIGEIYPVVEIKKDNLKNILTGKPIHNNDLKKKLDIEKDRLVCIFSDNQFIGIYKTINEGEILAKPEFVMQPII